MKSCAPASRAARSMRSLDASGSAKAMLAATESLNRNVSSNTMPTARRSACNGHIADVDPVEHDATGVDVVEAGDQAGDGRLAAAGGADQRDRLAGLHPKVEPVEDGPGRPGRIAERDGFEAELTGRRGPARPSASFTGVRCVDDLRLGHQHFVDPLARGDRPLRLGEDHAEHPQRPDQHHDVDVERDQAAEGQAAVDHLVAAVGEHEDQTDVRQQLERRKEDRAHAGGFDRLVVELVDLGAEPRLLHPLGAEALHDAHARDGLFDHGGDVAGLALDAHDGGMEPDAEPLGEDIEQRQAAEREQREDRVDRDEDDRDGRDGDRVGERERDHHEELLDLVEVRVGAAHEVPGLRLVVVGEVQPLEVREQPVAQRRLRPSRDPEGPPPPQTGERALHDADDADDDGPLRAARGCRRSRCRCRSQPGREGEPRPSPRSTRGRRPRRPEPGTIAGEGRRP